MNINTRLEGETPPFSLHGVKLGGLRGSFSSDDSLSVGNLYTKSRDACLKEEIMLNYVHTNMNICKYRWINEGFRAKVSLLRLCSIWI